MRTLATEMLWVGAGGCVGSVLRVLMSRLVQRFAPAGVFPAGTLVVNIVGCFAIGLAMEWMLLRPVATANTRAFLFLGLLGGFTTFSTFGYESVALARDAQLLHAAGNVLLHVVVGLGAVVAGAALARAI